MYQPPATSASLCAVALHSWFLRCSHSLLRVRNVLLWFDWVWVQRNQAADSCEKELEWIVDQISNQFQTIPTASF